jgi:hypothetical protein
MLQLRPPCECCTTVLLPVPQMRVSGVEGARPSTGRLSSRR